MELRRSGLTALRRCRFPNFTQIDTASARQDAPCAPRLNAAEAGISLNAPSTAARPTPLAQTEMVRHGPRPGSGPPLESPLPRGTVSPACGGPAAASAQSAIL